MKRFIDTLNFRLVEVEDAEFVLSLRLDENYGRYMKEVSPDVEAQRDWIRRYKADERKGLQYYYIVERKDGTPCGTVRIHDLQADSFRWGSFILNAQKTKYAFLETALYIASFAFDGLGLKTSYSDTRKDNKSMIERTYRMGAVLTGEDDESFYFEITREALEKVALESEKIITSQASPGS